MDKKEILELERIISYSNNQVERLMALLTLSDEIADSDFLRSWILANEAISEANQTNNRRLLGKAYMLSANALWKMADYSEARNQYEEALNIYGELEEMMGVSRAYCGIGIIYGELEDFESAGVAFKKAIDTSKAAGNEVFAATNLGNLGHVFLRFEEYDKALEAFFGAIEVYETVNYMDQGKANMYGGIAGVKVHLKKFTEGLDYLQLSLDIHRRLDNKRGIATGLRNMGEIHYRIGNFGGAIKFLNESLDLCSRTNYHSLIPEIHQMLARSYSGMGDEANATKHTRYYVDAKKLQKLERLKRQEELLAKQKEMSRLKKVALSKASISGKAKNN